MLLKIVTLLLLTIILYSLISALVFLVRDKGETVRVARALSWRIGLTLGAFGLVMLGVAVGWIHPHGFL